MITVDHVDESGLRFGPFSAGTCFHIEKSDVYTPITEHVKMVEFILHRGREGKKPLVIFVEAKTSAPMIRSTPAMDQCMKQIRKKPSPSHEDLPTLLNEIKSAESFESFLKELFWATQSTDYSTDIYEKFSNGFMVLVSMYEGRTTIKPHDISPLFGEMTTKMMDFRFFLVLSQTKREWLEPLKRYLSPQFNALAKIWNLDPNFFQILDEDLARTHKLLV